MLFSGLWSWLRPLSFALLFLLRGLTAVVGHPGLAIIALALSVKILLLPLTAMADRLQTQVNAVQARLQPGIDAINAAHKGEERARRTLALYREAGVHPLYTLKSLLGFLIQLPVFIAVFDMLAEDFDLHRVSFLWIPDLSRPDELLRLPMCVPFFGCHLNLLPFLMSGISLAALWRFRSRVLTPTLARRQRRNLAAMTLLFFAPDLDEQRRQLSEIGVERRGERRLRIAGAQVGVRQLGHAVTGHDGIRSGLGRVAGAAAREIDPGRDAYPRGRPREAALAQRDQGGHGEPAARRVAGQDDAPRRDALA